MENIVIELCPSNVKDISGLTFNSLEVLGFSQIKYGLSYWVCRCSCGTIKTISKSALKSGKTKTCGCGRRKRIDLTGKVFGRLEIVGYSHTKDKTAYWDCKCSCGNTKKVNGATVRLGRTKSCGCLGTEQRKIAQTIHGRSKNKEYRAYYGAKRRCTDPKDKHFKDYGERGIKFLFPSFQNFYAELGSCPKGMSLDRIDNNSNYKPGNVRWATIKEQSRNKRSNRLIKINGKKLTLVEWIEKSGNPGGRIHGRLKRGWCEECTLLLPIGKKCRHKNKNYKP